MAAPSWIQNDYWAPDRDQVLNDPSRWGTGPNGEVDPRSQPGQAPQQPSQPPQQPSQPGQPPPPTQSVDYRTPPPSGAPTTSPSGNTGVMPPPFTPAGVGSSTAGSYDRNSFRDAWMGSGAQTPAQLAQFINQHQGDFGAGVQILPGKGDMIRLPDGTIIDAVKAAGLGGQGAQWMGIPSQMGAGPGAPAGTPGGAPGSPGAPGGPGGSPNVGWGDNPTAGMSPTDRLIYELQQRANQSLNINAATDPNIRQQADPYAANLERQRRQYLNQQAEQQGPNANLTNEARLSAEQTGQQAGQFESGLIGNEVAARREEIQNALAQEGNLLTSQQQMALQKELAQLSDATQRYGINTNAQLQGNALNNDWMKALLLNDQFNNRLGLDTENSRNHWNDVFTS